MIITKIERQKHNSERFSVFIDGDFAFGMSGVDVLYYKLAAGEELTQERYDFLVNEVLFTKARESAYNCLAYKARTRREIRDKLSDYPAEVVGKVLDLLEEYGYLNDYEYAKDYVETRIRSKAYGRFRLRRELSEKGIEKNIIDEILSDIEFDEVEAAVGKLTRKAGGEPLSDREKRRFFGYLSRQGFGFDVIEQAFKEYESGV